MEEESELESSLLNLKKVEEEVKRNVEEEVKRREEVIFKAKVEVEKISDGAHKEAKKLKNDMFLEFRAKLEKEIESILVEARKTSENIKKSCVGKAEEVATQVVEKFFKT